MILASLPLPELHPDSAAFGTKVQTNARGMAKTFLRLPTRAEVTAHYKFAEPCRHLYSYQGRLAFARFKAFTSSTEEMHGFVHLFLVLLCVGLGNAQSLGSSTGTIIGTAVGLTVLVFLIVFCIIVALVLVIAKNNREVQVWRAQQRAQQSSTTPGYALQQPHHVNSMSSEATHNLDNGALNSNVPYTLESELQNAPPPTYSVSSRYPVYIDEAPQNESTSHGEETAKELPPSYVP